MEFLTQEDIIFINRRTIERHGGNFVPPDNILRTGALDYVVEIVQQEVFGQRVFEEVPDIAAAYMFYIVSGHIFQDGNKRTGLEAALLFLGLNGLQLKKELEHVTLSDTLVIPSAGQTSDEILIFFTLEMAAGTIDLDAAKIWFEVNIERQWIGHNPAIDGPVPL